MTVTVPESTWRELARQLADDISAVGKLHTTEWRAAVQDVPRHVFVPRYYSDDQDGRSRRWTLHEPDDPSSVTRWLELVYSRTTLVTQVADFADRGTQAAVSSSTKPDLMISMLEALDVADGMHVLEIGTGTGHNAALLSHRLGAGNVYSVDVDPQLVIDARDRLTRVGYTPTLAAVDGVEGLPEHAPFDRIIATCALFAVPAAWISQLRPDGLGLGLGLGHIEGPLGAGNLLALRHVAPDTDAAPNIRRTAVDPAQLDGGARFPFLAQLHLPHGVLRSMWRSDDGDTVTELRAPDGSWCEAVREPNPDATATSSGRPDPPRYGRTSRPHGNSGPTSVHRPGTSSGSPPPRQGTPSGSAPPAAPAGRCPPPTTPLRPRPIFILRPRAVNGVLTAESAVFHRRNGV